MKAYREWLPVVEIDGERAFVYFVDDIFNAHRKHAFAVMDNPAGDFDLGSAAGVITP